MAAIEIRSAIMTVRKAGTLDFSWVPAFLTANKNQYAVHLRFPAVVPEPFDHFITEPVPAEGDTGSEARSLE